MKTSTDQLLAYSRCHWKIAGRDPPISPAQLIPSSLLIFSILFKAIPKVIRPSALLTYKSSDARRISGTLSHSFAFIFQDISSWQPRSDVEGICNFEYLNFAPFVGKCRRIIMSGCCKNNDCGLTFYWWMVMFCIVVEFYRAIRTRMWILLRTVKRWAMRMEIYFRMKSGVKERRKKSHEFTNSSNALFSTYCRFAFFSKKRRVNYIPGEIKI